MSLTVGAQVGPYEILAPVGSGGMGDVWKARDTRLDRIVAIKRLKGEHGARFQQEARAIAALNHPHICQIYDIGPDYLVMEFVEGLPLKGPLPLDDMQRLAAQIASALEEAHARGILHRDLKPANILVTAKGSAKLLDFGLAKIMTSSDPAATHTVDGTVMGTPAYMSPEQARGERADERSDVFSLGAVLYEMCTGARAFPGNTFPEVVSSVLRDEPAPFNGPEGIAQIVKRCLRKAPTDRYQSAAEVRVAIQQMGHVETQKQPSIAVLPFANMSGDPENAYFSDGLAEEIINALTKLKGLRVIARASAFRFRGEPDLRKIADALRVEHVLEGSVRRAGNRLRVTAQLIQIADDSQVWSERYDREMTDVFAIQDEISQAIVEVLKVQLIGGQTPEVARKTANVDAYNAFLEGRYHFQQFTDDGFARARTCFTRAIELDANYGLPYAGLAECYLYTSLYHPAPTTESSARALAASEKCIQLDPNAAEGYMARGLVRAQMHYDWTAVEQDIDRALRLNPESALVRYRRGLWFLAPVNRMDEALAEIRRAVELDPLSVLTRGVDAFLNTVAGRMDVAVRAAYAALDLQPSAFIACFLSSFALVGGKQMEKALSVLERGLEAAPGNLWLTATKATVLGHMGRRDALQEMLASVHDRATREYVPSLVLGVIHAAAGNLDEAFRWLDAAIEERQPWTTPFLISPVIADFVRGPRYDNLLRRMKLPVR